MFDTSRLSYVNDTGDGCDFPRKDYSDDGRSYSLHQDIDYQIDLGFNYKQISEKSCFQYFPLIKEVHKNRSKIKKDREDKLKEINEKINKKLNPFQGKYNSWDQKLKTLGVDKGYIQHKINEYNQIKKFIINNNSSLHIPLSQAEKTRQIVNAIKPVAYDKTYTKALAITGSELSKKLTLAQLISGLEPPKLLQIEDERTLIDFPDVVSRTSIHLKNPNQAIEDKLDQQIRQNETSKQELRLLREELKETKELNLVKNVKTRDPNINRPTKFKPPTTYNDASEFAKECIYWFEEEHGELPVFNELWRMIKSIASQEGQVIQGFDVEMMDRKNVLIGEISWDRENARKYCNSYLS